MLRPSDTRNEWDFGEGFYKGGGGGGIEANQEPKGSKAGQVTDTFLVRLQV